MGIKRYEVSDGQWERIAPMLPGKASDPGRTATDNRLFVNAVLWVLRGHRARIVVEARPLGARRRVGAGVSGADQRPGQRISDDRQRHRSCSCPGRHRPKRGVKDQALGRSRGGLTSKWHVAVDSLGRPIRFILTGGQANDSNQALALIAGLTAAHVIADKAYDTHAILDHVEAIGALPIIPKRSRMNRMRDFDPGKYKRRNLIERSIGKLKQLRRIATRYDRLPENYLASLYLASLSFWC